MRKRKKMTAGLLSVILLAGCSKQVEPAAVVSGKTAELEPVIHTETAGIAGKKSETVTVQADACGNPQKTTVAVTLGDLPETDSVRDVSDLSDVRNIKGDEEFTYDEYGNPVWQNFGSDIRYEGTAVNPVPFAVEVAYLLDGQSISPEELAGKSGDVTIRFTYTNKTGSAYGTDYVPFMAMTVLLLDGEWFSDVRVDHGRVSEMAGRTAVIGYAVPGFSEAMKFRNYEMTGKIEVPESVEITAHTEGFRLAFTSTVVTGGLLKEIADDDLKEGDRLVSDMNEMAGSFRKILDGTNELKNGMTTYQGYLNQYIDGVGALTGYSDRVQAASDTLQANLPSVITRIETAATGLNQMNRQLAQLDIPAMDTASQAVLSRFRTDAEELERMLALWEADVSAVRTYMADSIAYAEAVGSGIATAQAALAPVSLADLNDSAKIGAANAARAVLSNPVYQLTAEQQEEISGLIYDRTDISAELSARESVINGGLAAALTALGSIPAAPSVPVCGSDPAAIQTLVNRMVTDAETLRSIFDHLGTLPDMADQLKMGIAQLTAAANQINGQLQQRKAEIQDIPAQLGKLVAGMKKLASASSTMKDSYGKIIGGTDQLADGLNRYYTEGILKLSRIGTVDLAGLLKSLRTLRAADRAYDTFTGLTEGTEGSVRFIIETAEIK